MGDEEWASRMNRVCVEAKAVRRELCRNCVPVNKKSENCSNATLCFSSGTTRNRTGDTRIFSPLLYQLSYGTIRDTRSRRRNNGLPRSWCKGSQKICNCKSRTLFFSADLRTNVRGLAWSPDNSISECGQINEIRFYIFMYQHFSPGFSNPTAVLHDIWLHTPPQKKFRQGEVFSRATEMNQVL